ncbi:predicted protein [Verticillium alfalfae VaMs.102]|uniref:Predicted protein n=1 Tax=Verticillium alfalfae (strain VaMs.102 / ATCC MYA-4576 / FGSC 10136) TaxID=526221 RepID=C9SAD3_VERA1|nr:predicted protein [Verticillium alfalfae VaMs.102]EEY15410.1 predicted protein [Verticillium alfalfae VaMs.102]
MTLKGDGRFEREEACDGSTDRAWGSIAADVPAAHECIMRCQRQFFERTLTTYDWASFNWARFYDNAETIPSEACETLFAAKDKRDDSPLWELYCCDSLLCGVQTRENPRQDPNVNSIMLHCQNRGLPPLHDPGPPPGGYLCPLDSVAQGEDGLPCQRANAKFGDVLPGSAVDGVSITVITTETKPQPSLTTTSTTTAASDAVILAQPDTSSNSNEGPGPLSAGSRAAIAVCCVLFLIVFLVSILCYLRRRRQRDQGYPPSLRYADSVKPADSPTPLISPTMSAEARSRTSLPPLRLRDRRLLPTILTPDPASSDHLGHMPGSPRAPPPTYSSFPPSPLRSPATSKLVPRHEHTVQTEGRSSGTTPTETLSFRSSGSTHTVGVSAYSTATASSPSRPPRPHEFPLEIPDLVSPGLGCGGQTPRPGPPPNRSLPPAPPVSPSSASWPTPSMNHVHGDVGVAVGVVSHSHAQGVTLRPESRELCELTERYERESRDSWGSWGGNGGRGPAVVAPDMQGTGAGRTRGPVLGEADLERMGGKYSTG